MSSWWPYPTRRLQQQFSTALFKLWICHYRVPIYPVTDQGKEFCTGL